MEPLTDKQALERIVECLRRDFHTATECQIHHKRDSVEWLMHFATKITAEKALRRAGYEP